MMTFWYDDVICVLWVCGAIFTSHYYIYYYVYDDWDDWLLRYWDDWGEDADDKCEDDAQKDDLFRKKSMLYFSPEQPFRREKGECWYVWSCLKSLKLVLPVWSSIIWSFILYYRYIQVNYSGIDELLINCCVAVELLMMAMMHDNERLWYFID